MSYQKDLIKDNAVRIAEVLRNGTPNEVKINICRVDTGSYIYEAFIKIMPTNNYEIWVYKSNRVSMVNRAQQVLVGTQVRVSGYGIEYDNQCGAIKIPNSISIALVKTFKEVNKYL